MVLDIRIITLEANCILQIVHVTGMQMIAFGIDGLLRGELQIEALLHGGLSGILLLHLSAINHSPALKSWITSWAGDDLRFASPEDWFYTAQQAGDYTLPQ